MAVNIIRYAQGENISDTLSTSIGSSDTAIPVNSISKWSANGGNVIIDRGTTSQEIIAITGVSGSSLVVPSGGRGFDGTTAVGHNSGATIESVPFAKDWNDLITGVLNVLKIADGTVDNTKVAIPSNISDFATNFANFVKSGLTIPTSATLSATSVLGVIYYGGIEISVASDGGHTYTATNDCYVDVSNAGVYAYNTVANGATAPALTANSIRVAKVVTSATAVTGVTQDGSLDSNNIQIYPTKPAIIPVSGTSYLQTSNSPTINTPITNQGIITVSAQAFDGTQKGNIFTRTLAANETFTQSGFSTGRVFLVKVKQGSATSYTITWWATITWITSGATAPIQTATSNGFTTYGFVCTGTNTFDGYLVATE